MSCLEIMSQWFLDCNAWAPRRKSYANVKSLILYHKLITACWKWEVCRFFSQDFIKGCFLTLDVLYTLGRQKHIVIINMFSRTLGAMDENGYEDDDSESDESVDMYADVGEFR